MDGKKNAELRLIEIFRKFNIQELENHNPIGVILDLHRIVRFPYTDGFFTYNFRENMIYLEYWGENIDDCVLRVSYYWASLKAVKYTQDEYLLKKKSRRTYQILTYIFYFLIFFSLLLFPFIFEIAIPGWIYLIITLMPSAVSILIWKYHYSWVEWKKRVETRFSQNLQTIGASYSEEEKKSMFNGITEFVDEEIFNMLSLGFNIVFDLAYIVIVLLYLLGYL